MLQRRRRGRATLRHASPSKNSVALLQPAATAGAGLASVGTPMRAQLTTAAIMVLARCTPYLEDEMLGLHDLIEPGSVCVDVGAAAGLYTLVMSRLAGPDGEVHSFEPLSFARPVWSKVLAARTAANVHHHALALGSEPGTGVMSVPIGRFGPVTGRSFLTGGSHDLGSNAEFSEHVSVDVPVSTLDCMCADAALTGLDFIKIDTEGAELQVLRGGERAIKEFRPVILVEIEARHAARYQCEPGDIVDWLAQHGYVMYAWRNGWRPAEQVSFGTRNYLFRPGAAS
jgi:FkbM family methyltransferase